MTEQQALDLYFNLTESIHAYWGAFGAVAIVLFGWVLSRKKAINVSQRIALSIGWFASAGYLSSSLMGKYRLLNALVKDIQSLQLSSHLTKTNLLSEITKYSTAYEYYELLVWSSSCFITLGILFVLWSNLLAEKPGYEHKS